MLATPPAAGRDNTRSGLNNVTSLVTANAINHSLTAVQEADDALMKI